MNSLLDKIQEAQKLAAEKVVCDNLDKLSLNGAGGITRRMKPQEVEIQTLKEEVSFLLHQIRLQENSQDWDKITKLQDKYYGGVR